MMSSSYSKIQHRQSCGSCLKHFMIVANIVFALVACAVIAVFIYLHITQVEFVQSVLGTNLVAVASILLIASGCLLFLLAIIGIVGGCIDRMTAFAVYFGLMIPLFLVILAGIVCAFVFRTWLTEQVRYQMEATLVNYYGVNLDNEWNVRVTNGWDRAQSLWQCCSVDDQSWGIYQKSEWYKIQPGTPGDVINPKPYVPASCCATDSSGYISEGNRKMCQLSSDGPPARRQGSQYAGHVNHALYYRGCYLAAHDYLVNETPSWFGILVGVGSTVAILMLIGIILSIVLYSLRRRELRINNSYVSYSQQSGTVLF